MLSVVFSYVCLICLHTKNTCYYYVCSIYFCITCSYVQRENARLKSENEETNAERLDSLKKFEEEKEELARVHQEQHNTAQVSCRGFPQA